MTIGESKTKLDNLEKKIAKENPEGWSLAMSMEKKSKEIAQLKLDNIVKWVSPKSDEQNKNSQSNQN